MRKRGKNWQLSEQNLVDCSKLDFGCLGGWPTNAFYYVRDHGISNGSKYLYKGLKQECQRNGTRFPSVLKVPNVCEVYVNGREDHLKSIIANNGPIAGAICKSFFNFFLTKLLFFFENFSNN